MVAYSISIKYEALLKKITAHIYMCFHAGLLFPGGQRNA